MGRYIYGPRRGIHIIDLSKTVRKFDAAYDFIVDTVSNGKPVLFVGTKKQAQGIFREEAQRAGQYFVTNRWLGGTLTNWRTIKKSIARLRHIEGLQEDGTTEAMTKKEALRLERQRIKLERNLGGIKDMDKMPGAMFLIDPRKEHIAVAEANNLHIPVVAIVDTNCDPDRVDWVVPGNDDAIRSIRLFASAVADACLEGKQRASERRQEAATSSVHVSEEAVTVTPSAAPEDGPQVQKIVRRPKLEKDATDKTE